MMRSIGANTFSWPRVMTTCGVILFAAAALMLSACSDLDEEALNYVDLTEFAADENRLLMNGPINSRSYAQFIKALNEHPEVDTLVALNVPGSLDDETMIRLGYEVRRRGLNTHLESDSEVFSGGVDLFLAGVERTAAPGAVLGVHSWYDGERDGADYPRGAPEHEANRAYVEAMLGDDAFYWFTLEAAPADDIHEMTAAEIARFGILTAGN